MFRILVIFVTSFSIAISTAFAADPGTTSPAPVNALAAVTGSTPNTRTPIGPDPKWGWFRRNACRLIVGAFAGVTVLAVGGAIVWMNFTHVDGPVGEEIQGNPEAEKKVDEVQAKNDLFTGADPVDVQFANEDGTPPTISIFRANALQRSLSRMFNEFQLKQKGEYDPKKEVPQELRVSFEGVRLNVAPDNADEVEVTIRGMGRELKLDKRISRKDLESGKEINIKLEPSETEIPDVGKTRIEGSGRIQYLRERGTIKIHELGATLTLTTNFGLETSDSGKISNFIGTVQRDNK